MIREYQKDDLDDLLEVWYHASLVGHPFLDDAFLNQERENVAKIYIPMAETWVYVREARVVGFISLIGHEVGAIFVDPNVQGQGIGRALMDHARALRGELEVEVFKANRVGRRFYDRYGFVLEDEYIHEQTGQPALRLRLRGR
ncbi:MAG: GNAT family N-acetyltransferase [Ardenticatenaceae bacterium]|nr:GNAT family N-acetyltransferase [Ardenticatenaceae bacterium]